MRCPYCSMRMLFFVSLVRGRCQSCSADFSLLRETAWRWAFGVAILLLPFSWTLADHLSKWTFESASVAEFRLIVFLVEFLLSGAVFCFVFCRLLKNRAASQFNRGKKDDSDD